MGSRVRVKVRRTRVSSRARRNKPGKFLMGDTICSFSNVENDVITRPNGEEGQVNRGLNEEWRCNYGWTAEGDVKSS